MCAAGGVLRWTPAREVLAGGRSSVMLAKVTSFLKLMVADLSFFFPGMKIIA
jgi:hypothetical protein